MQKSWLLALIDWISNLFPAPVPTPAPTPVPVPDPVTPSPPAPDPDEARNYLYSVAVSFLGKDASPADIAPDELACAETVWDILHAAFPADIPSKPVALSTSTLYKALKEHPKFQQVPTTWGYGDIIISPTGMGNGSIPHGHVGIVAHYGIMSNDSATGLFKENYTIARWVGYFRNQGGYPIYFFRRVAM